MAEAKEKARILSRVKVEGTSSRRSRRRRRRRRRGWQMLETASPPPACIVPHTYQLCRLCTPLLYILYILYIIVYCIYIHHKTFQVINKLHIYTSVWSMLL